MIRTLLFMSLTCFITSLTGANVGLLVMATGKYIQFVEPLLLSADHFFLKDHHVTYYVFTDGTLPEQKNLVVTPQARLGWPIDTLNRYHVYYQNRDLFANEDFLFAVDADMLFRGKVGDEILGNLVATLHPGFNNQRGTYEVNPISLACVLPHEGSHYFAGGFYGGATASFLEAIKTNMDHIDADREKGFIAVWHDESHWNRYCIDHPPEIILSSAYCCPANWGLPFSPKLEPLTKNHHEFRKD